MKGYNMERLIIILELCVLNIDGVDGFTPQLIVLYLQRLFGRRTPKIAA
jgi:hypothetical protein